MRNKIIISLIAIFFGVITWGIVYAVGIFGDNSDINPAIPLPPDTIITIPKAYEPEAIEQLVLESRFQEEKEALQRQKAMEKYQSLLRFGVTDTTEWKIYQNSEAGISFQYPDIFNRVNMQVVNGDTGRIFTGVLEFFPNHWISFGGITEDYSATRGGTITDTRGYTKKGDDYFVFGVRPEAYAFWEYNNNNSQALVVTNTEIGQVLSRESVAVFVNIPNSPFSGIVFEIHPLNSSEPVDKKDIEILRQIVSSITFTK